MRGGVTLFNTHAPGASAEGRRLVTIVCPGCKSEFRLMPGVFAARKKAAKGRPICCSRSCSNLFLQDEREAQRAKLIGGVSS